MALLSFGCPLLAIVFALGRDERAIASWQKKAGEQGQRVHEQIVQAPQDLQQALAGQLYGKAQGWDGPGPVRSQPALARRRGRANAGYACLRALAKQGRACAARRPLLLMPDGWRGQITVWQQVFREPVPTKKRGRPVLLPWPAVATGQILKWQEAGRVIGICVCRLWGEPRQLPAGQALNSYFR